MSAVQAFSLVGKVGLISGASSGLGRRAAKVMAAAGARVICCARRSDLLNDLVAEIRTDGGEAEAMVMDVARDEGVEDGVARVFELHERIDIVVNSAGIARSAKFIDVDSASFDEMFNVNVKGVWRVSQAVARRLVAAGHGASIINIASMLGLAAHPMQSLYCATKGAVLQLTRAMAIELIDHGIRANAICPGYFESEMTAAFVNSDAGARYIKRTPARRFGAPEELDGAILFLASDAAAFVNGAQICVDGGHTARLL